MVDRKTGLRLPLMHHLVQNRVLDFRPRVAKDMTPADGDLGGPTGCEVYRQLSEPGAHPAGDPDGDGAEAAAEMLPVQPLMAGREAPQQGDVARAGALAAGPARGRWRVQLHREAQELPLGETAHGTGQSRIQEPDDRAKHPVRRAGVPLVETEPAPRRERNHDGAIGMGVYAADITKAEEFETVREQIVHFRAPDRLPPPRPRPAARPGGQRSRRPR
jgi:hypothetical protein